VATREVADEVLPARERIMAAAIEGLTTLDPAALAIQRICDRSGVKPPTLYYHFGSKDGLVAAAVESLVAGWIRQLDESIDRGGTLADTLDQAVAAWQAMITSPQRPFAVFIWVSMWSEESREALVQAREHAQKLIHDEIAVHVGPARGSDDLAGLILDGVLGAAVDYQLDSDIPALRRRLTTLTTLIRLSTALGADPS